MDFDITFSSDIGDLSIEDNILIFDASQTQEKRLRENSSLWWQSWFFQGAVRLKTGQLSQSD